MIGRIVWFAAVAAVAAITIVVQIDRQSRVTPALAASVPAPFRAFAQAHVTADALTRNDDPQAALDEARRLILRRPIPAENLRLLALAQYRAGQEDKAGLTVQIAAKRGWRDLSAQEAMLRIALAVGDEPEAARRYGALLLSKGAKDELLVELGPQVFGPRGRPKSPSREAFVEIVAGSDRWLPALLHRGPQVMPSEAFAEIVIKSRERGSPYSCRELQQAAAMLSRRDPAASNTLSEAISADCNAPGR